MHDRDARDRLAAMRRDLELVAARMPDARRNLRHWSGRGYPTSSMGGGLGHGVHDPVAQLVVAGPDDLMRDLARSEEELERAALALTRLVRFVMRHTTTANPARVDEGCRLCAQHKRFNVVYARERCRWHYDFEGRWGEDAHPAVTLLYLDGRRVSEQFIRSYLSTASR